MGREQINPFAVGGAFVEYCIEQGYIELLIEEHEVKYYLTSDGETALKNQFGIILGTCAKIN